MSLLRKEEISHPLRGFELTIGGLADQSAKYSQPLVQVS